MKYTQNYNLKKPEGTDVVNIDDLNYNADVIDTELAKRIINSGNVPSIQAGLDANKPAPGTAGRLYVATDTQVIYRDTGTLWVKVGAVKWGDIDGKPASFTPAAHGNEAHDPDFALVSDLTAHLADTAPHSSYVPLKTTSNITLYVDATTGNDANPGTSVQPLKTIQAAINKIPQIVNHAVVINVMAGTYNEDISIIGFSGKGIILLVGANQVSTTHNISSLLVKQCTVYVNCSGFNITTTTKEAVRIEACTNVNINLMNITQASNYAGIVALTSLVRVADNQISNRNEAIVAGLSSIIFSLNNSGTGNNVVLQAGDAGKIGLWGTQPSGTTTISAAGGGQVLS